MKEGLPLTRPTFAYAGLDSFEGDAKHATFKLFPGAANMGEFVTCSVLITAVIDEHWVTVAAAFTIDETAWPAKPGLLYLARDPLIDYPVSAAIHFPTLAITPFLAGRHTMLLRTVARETKSVES